MSAGISNGVTTVPAGGSQPIQLDTPATSSSVVMYAPSTNTNPVYIGGPAVTTSNGIPIAAGASLTVAVGDVGSLYVAGTQNDVVRWLASGRTLPA